MTQSQFLRSLARKLRGLPAGEREEALRYYREYLQEAGIPRGEDVTDRVGTPEQAARAVLADAQIRQTQAKLQRERRASTVRVLLGVLLFIPLLVAFSVLLAFGLTGAGLGLGGLAALCMTFFTDGLAQGLIVAGYALLLISVGVLLVIGALVLTRLLARAVRALLLREKGDAHV